MSKAGTEESEGSMGGTGWGGRIAARAFKTLASVVILVTVVWVVAGDWARERSQLARVVSWLDADVGDIDRFAARRIATGPSVDELRTGSGHDVAFEPVRLIQDGDTTLHEFDRFLEERDTWAYLVLRGDSVMHERYFGGKGRETLFTTFSMSKSILSAAVGAALDRGLIRNLDDPVTEYLPELLQQDPRFSEVTLHHLITMSSGLRFERGNTPWGDEASTYYAPDLRGAALKTRVVDDPGSAFLYNNYNPLLVGWVLERATGRTLSAFFSETVWAPLGTEADGSWSIDSDTHGFEKMESGFNARARDIARFGRMYLRMGLGPEGPILPEAWIRRSVAADSVSDPSVRYQYFWWVLPQDDVPDQYYAEGRFGQFVFVVPDLDMVFVRLGRDDGDINWARFFSRQAASIRSGEEAG